VPLPKAIRRLTPDRIRHDVRLRALGVGTGLIPPRLMHTQPEADQLADVASTARTAVEIGVYEGSSALVLVRSLPVDAVLHLVDPFVDSRGLAAGWRGTAWATRRVVDRAVRERGGPTLRWHVERSEETGRRWATPVDLVFVDGDHSEEACRLDWELWHPFVEPGGVIAFHDARAGRPGGWGDPGPTAVVDRLFRGEGAVTDWEIAAERDTVLAVRRR
jgi:predicted O-methyltransferase YrrM